MNASANVPTLLAATASLKYKPPGPSTPANIPIARKRINAGTLIFSDNDPATRLMKKSRPATRNGSIILSICYVIELLQEKFILYILQKLN